MIQQSVVLRMLYQVLVDYPLLLKEISGQLVLYVDLVMLILNLSKLLQRDTVLT